VMDNILKGLMRIRKLVYKGVNRKKLFFSARRDRAQNILNS